MARKNRNKPQPKPPAAPKWIENSRVPRSQEEKQAAINARLAFRSLRRALGLTQPEMALRLDVPLATVQGAESGWRPVGRELARLIQARFGVFASSVTGYIPEPGTLLREKVTPESVQRVFSNIPPEIPNEEVEDFTKSVESLVLAAARSGKLRVFGALFKDAIWELRRELDLDESLAAVLRPDSKPPHITYGDLRHKPELATGLAMAGFVDDPSRRDDEIFMRGTAAAAKSLPFIRKSKWIPDWNDFVDKDGNVHWADQRQAP